MNPHLTLVLFVARWSSFQAKSENPEKNAIRTAKSIGEAPVRVYLERIA